jgi:hypothetical protein
MSWLSFFGSKNKNEQSSQAEVIAAPPCQQVADKPKPKSQSPFLTDTFCILPWAHLSTRPNGHMRVCCTANASSAAATNDKKWGGEVGILKNDDGKPANLNHTTLSQGWNNGYMKSIRKQMLNGEVPLLVQSALKKRLQVIAQSANGRPITGLAGSTSISLLQTPKKTAQFLRKSPTSTSDSVTSAI